MTETMTETPPEVLYCANHPQVPTALRCNKCGKLICPKCAVRTPVGYRCKACVSQQQQVFETAVWYDYLVAAVIAAPVATVAGFLVMSLGFFVLFLAPVVGGVVAELVRVGVRRRRGRYLNLVAVGAFVLGCLPVILSPLIIAGLSLLTGFGGRGAVLGLGSLVTLIWPLVYTVIGASTLYARLRGISINT
jgi:uncharacterized membrane protein